MRGLIRYAAVAAGAAMALLGPAAAASASQTPALSWAPATLSGTYNYGTLNAGQTASQAYTLTNSGGAASGTRTVTATGAQASVRRPPVVNPYSPAYHHPYRHGVVPTIGRQKLMKQWARSHPSAGALSADDLGYGGGVDGIGVTTGPEKVYLVFYGSQWGTQGTDSNGDVTLSGDTSGEAPYLQELLKGLGTGGELWSGVMTQYCDGVAVGAQSCPAGNMQHVAYPFGGALAGVWVDESAASPQMASAQQLGVEAVNAAAHFGNPTAASNRDAQYVILSPTGTNPDGFPNSGFCAWHDYNNDVGASSPYGDIAFTNLPYITDAGQTCGQDFVNPSPNGTLDGVSIVEGHEYAETITDQNPPGGWTDSSGQEAGDKCAWDSGRGAFVQDVTLATGSFAMQPTWTNDAGGGVGTCEISHPIVFDNTVTVAGPGNQTGTVGTAVSLQIQASDSDGGQTLTYSATGLPAGLSINSSSGLISGTPATAGSRHVTVTATDTTHASGSASFTWTITAAGTATSLSSSGSTSQYGQPVTFTATVTPTDGGGTVAFYADGSATPISGCGARSLAQATGSTYTASCTTASLPAGSHAISATYSGDSDYASSSGSLAVGQTVTPAPLTVTASDAAMTYGGTPPVITPSYSGFVNGDGPGALTTAPTCSTTATSVSPAGTYPARCSGAADPNYAISYVTGTVTVTKAAQSISFLAPATGAAGTSAALFATGGGSGNPVTFTTDPASGAGVCSVSGTTVSYTAAGTCVIDANQAGNANYTAAPQVTQTITVTRAAPTLTTTAGGTVVVAGAPLTDTAALSGGASPAGTITFTLHDPDNTVVYTDHVTVTGNGTYSTAAGDNPGGLSPTIAGTYTWAVSYSGDSNNTQATASAETQAAVYGFGGFTAPLPKSTLQKSGSTIPVKFRLTNAAGQPISPTAAAALAAANDMQATLSGPKITTVPAVCTWNSTTLLFQCNIKTPSGLVTGTAYQITAQENVTGTFVTAPAVTTATTPNPETVYFK